MKPVKGGKLAEDTDRKEDQLEDPTRTKIKKHLSDINDVITDDDIKNAVVPGINDVVPEPKMKERKRKKDRKNGLEKPPKNEDSSLASWSVLEE